MVNPSPFHTSMADLLAYFRFQSMDASPALFERDALWCSENEALRSEVSQLETDRRLLNLGFQDSDRTVKELDRQLQELRTDLAKRDQNEEWLNQGFCASEERAEKERVRSKELEEKMIAMERQVEEAREVKAAVERDHRNAIEKFGASERLWSALALKAQGELRERIGVLEKEKAEKDSEIGRVLMEKMALENRNKILEEESSGKISELEKKVVALEYRKMILEMESNEKNSELEKKAEQDFEIGRLCEEKIALENRNKILEMEAQVHRVKKDDEFNRIVELSKEQKRVGEEVEKQVSGLLDTIMILKRDKEELSAKFLRMEKERAELRAEKIAVEKHMGRVEEANEEKIEELYGRIQVLEEEVEKKKKKIHQLVKMIETLKDKERGNTELMSGLRSSFEKERAQKDTEIGRVLEEKMALEKLKTYLEEEVEKKETMVPQLADSIVELMDEKRVDADLILKLTSSLEKEKVEKDTEIQRLLEEKMTLEELKCCLEEELKKLKRNMEKESLVVLELRRNIEVLEKEKAERDIEVGRVFTEKMALETRNKILEEESNEKISELERKVVVLEGEKVEMEAQVHKEKNDVEMESDEKILELERKVVVLEWEKVEMEAQVYKEKKDVGNELNKALETQKRMQEEVEKRVSGFMETIMVLEKDKEALVTKVSKLHEQKHQGAHNIEMLEKIHVILNGNIAVEDYEQKTSELNDRIRILERDKRDLEASIKVLGSKFKEDARITDNVGTQSPTPWQHDGHDSAGVAYSSKHHGSVNDSVETIDGKSDREAETTRTNAGKRKRSIIKCEPGIKIAKPACEHLLNSTGVVDNEPVPVPCDKVNTRVDNSSLPTNGSNGVTCRWEADQDLLDALEVDDELCLKAVCALYRQHKRLQDLENTSSSPGSSVFKPEYLCRGTTFGRYLTTEDPKCRGMKKLVRKLNRLDPLAVGVCRNVAKQHYKQVFEIYIKKEDSFFLC